MKRKILILAIALFFIIPVIPNNGYVSNDDTYTPLYDNIINKPSLSGFSESGDDTNGVKYFSKVISYTQSDILNTYADTSIHSDSIDLSEYQIDNWDLYCIEVNINNMTASVEREVAGSASAVFTNFMIDEYGADVYYSNLAQGFYSQPYYGNLLNYSVNYATTGYVPATRGYAYLEVRDSYSSSSNLTSLYQMSAEEGAFNWHTVSGENVILDSATQYYVIINGTDLHEDVTFNTYPEIYWGNEGATGSFQTRRYSTEFGVWTTDLSGYEALLNYTYIPWNTSSSSPISFSSPSEISLKINNTDIGSSSIFYGNDISLLTLNTNQSITLNYNMTLWYNQSVSLNTVWNISDSGNNVDWNITNYVSYTNIAGDIELYLNITKMPDWAVNGLYNDTVSHLTYTSYSTVVSCSDMSNGTWTLTSTAPNYVRDLRTFDDSGMSEIHSESSIIVDIYVNSTISDGTIIVTTGSTNLTVSHDGSYDYMPSDYSVTNGFTEYTWDVSTYNSGNGNYMLEMRWTNGTESGYVSKNITIFYPTSFSALSTHIDDYTDDTFGIEVYYNDTFTNTGVEASRGIIKYSFDGDANITMSDQTNGVWTATVDTTGRISGSYNIYVYAEGYALENRSLIISVDLIYETLPLEMSLSSNNITYTESTILSVNYKFVNGTDITDATITAIIGSDTWILSYNSTHYVTTFIGADARLGIGSFDVTVNATGIGYLSMEDTTSFVVRNEPTTISESWATNTFSWTESVTFSLQYIDSKSNILSGATAYVYINGIEYLMTETIGTYSITLNNTFDLGYHTISVNVTKYGFDFTYMDNINFTILEESSFISTNWTPSDASIDYGDSLEIAVDYTYGSGDIDTGIVNVTINSITFGLSYNGTYWTASINGSEIGVGVWDATVEACSYGYEYQTTITGINITIASNAFIVIWQPSDMDISYVEHVNISVIYQYDSSPVIGATVRVFINGTVFYLSYNPLNEMWERTFDRYDVGIGYWNMTVYANHTGYDSGLETSYLNIYPDTPSMIPSWTDNITVYTSSILISVEISDSMNISIPDGNIVVSVDGRIFTGVYNTDRYDIVIGPMIPIGDNSLNVTFYQYGYDTITIFVDLHVDEVDLVVSISGSPSLYVNDTTIFNIIVKASNNTNIDVTDIDISWASTYGISHDGEGTYRITINSDNMHVGNYLLNITLYRYGYTHNITLVDIDVIILTTDFETESYLSQYENETISVIFTYTDTFHDVPISWGNVYMVVNSFSYNASYSDNSYTCNIWLNSSFSDTNYTISIYASASDCEPIITYVEIEIIEKTTYIITLNVDDEVLSGGILGVTITVTLDGSAVSGLPITVYALFTSSEGIETVVKYPVTNNDGDADATFEVPSGTTSIDVYAEYEGSNSEWRVISATHAVSIREANIIEALVAFVQTPFGFIAILGIVSGIIVGARSYARRSVKKFDTQIREEGEMREQESFDENVCNARHISIMHSDGRTLYHKLLSGSPIEAELLTGAISAVSSIFTEVSDVESQLRSIEYDKYNVLVGASGNIKCIMLVDSGELSETIKVMIQVFTETFEERYHDETVDWNGNLDIFDKEWIKDTLRSLIPCPSLFNDMKYDEIEPSDDMSKSDEDDNTPNKEMSIDTDTSADIDDIEYHDEETINEHETNKTDELDDFVSDVESLLRESKDDT